MQKEEKRKRVNAAIEKIRETGFVYSFEFGPTWGERTTPDEFGRMTTEEKRLELYKSIERSNRALIGVMNTSIPHFENLLN